MLDGGEKRHYEGENEHGTVHENMLQEGRIVSFGLLLLAAYSNFIVNLRLGYSKIYKHFKDSIHN